MNGCRTDSPDDEDRPRFAVIRLKPESNLLGLFQLLLCNGFGEVAFVKNLDDCNFGGNKDTGGTCAKVCTETECVGQGKGTTNAASSFSSSKQRLFNSRKSPPGLFEASELILKFGGSVGGSGGVQNSADHHGTEKSILQTIKSHRHEKNEKSRSTINSEIGRSVNQSNSATGRSILNSEVARSINQSNSELARSMNQSELSRSINQSHSDISISPGLPLSTLSCPLPLPVDTTVTAKSSSKSAADPGKKTAAAKSSSAKESGDSSTSQFTSTQPISQRSGTKETPQQQVFVSCHLCNSKIMATRFSNLTNHVRRHAPVKQFQCCYCDYAHNEIAKVRLHMANNHGDKKSRPINNINAEMQDTWRRLMRECFPERCKRQRQPQQPKPQPSQPTATAIISHGTHIATNSGKKKEEKGDHLKLPKLDPITTATSASLFGQLFGDECQWTNEENMDGEGQRFARCDQCYTYVDVNMKESHVRTCHLNNLPSVSFVCSLCGLESIERNEVEMHIRIEHPDSPDCQVINADMASYIGQMIDEYFPVHALEYTTNFNGNIFDRLAASSTASGDGGISGAFALFNGAIEEHLQEGMKRKCRVCRRFIRNGDCWKHAHRHVKMSAVYFECPICAGYRSNVIGRVHTHLVNKHGITSCDDVPRFVRKEWIPVISFRNAVAQATNRCFATDRPTFKRRRAWKKYVYLGKIQK